MATPQEITYRKAGVEYHEERLSEFGGWNADATDATLGRDEFTEIRNFRRPTTGDFEVRTGVATTELQNTTGANVLAKCEYRSDFLQGSVTSDTFFDVTLFLRPSDNAIAIAILDPISGFQKTVIVTTVSATAESWIVQYAWSLIVTVKGTGSFEVYPTDTTLATWIVRSLGKDVCPTPSFLDFALKTTGDLLVIDNNGTDLTGAKNTVLSDQIRTDPVSPPDPLLIPLPIAADYWLIRPPNGSVSVTGFEVNDPKKWVWNSTDVTADGPDATRNAYTHNKTRAWGYRFVAVQQFVNAKGEKYRVRSAASVDLWIPDMTYGPAQLGPQPGDFGTSWATHDAHTADWNTYDGSIPPALYTALDRFFNNDPNPGAQRHPDGINGVYHVCYPQTNVGNTVVNSLPLPSATDFQKLIDKYRNFSKDKTSDPYWYLAWYFGMRYLDEGPKFGQQAPYLTEVPASKLKQAPMTVFDWANFDRTLLENTGGTVTEIEVYRTAHSEPNDKDNTTKDPNFEPHKYGYVGSILANGTFTDDVVDDAIDFGTTPQQQDGYLRGEFSGSVMREFDNRLVVGDVVTYYHVLPPAPWGNIIDGSYFYFDVSTSSPATSYTQPKMVKDIDPAAPAGELNNQVTEFFLAYVDINGIQSAATMLGTSLGGLNYGLQPGDSATELWASFVLPRGYDATITQGRLYRGVWNATTHARDYTLLMTLNITNGNAVYISKNDETSAAQLSDLTGEVKRSEAPGSVIFSEPNQIYFWPPLNFESHHQFAPVRALEVVLGPLYVMTDMSISLTELNGRREELTKHIGPISRFAVQKVDKIVFLLSPYGMYYIESSGVVQFPANVQTAILPYLQEAIPGVLPLTNVRRASLGFLGERNELWLHLPSSYSIFGTPDPITGIVPRGQLPHRTILFKLGAGNDPRTTINYEFDLREDFERADKTAIFTPSGDPVEDQNRWQFQQVFFLSRAMGGLLASFYDAGQAGICTLDNDVPGKVWPTSAAMEKSWHMGDPNVKKTVREVVFRTEGSAAIRIGTSQPTRHAPSRLKGRMNRLARLFDVIDTLPPLRHIVANRTLESVATAPVTRILTLPDKDGIHNLHVKAIDIFAQVVNNHP